MKKNIDFIIEKLKTHYPEAKTSLDFATPFQLLIATILSAQCTDERVNIVTKDLFKKYPDAKSMANADIEDIKKLIYSTGFYNNKAKNIKATAEKIADKYSGETPDNMAELTDLPGVARKTANCVLGTAYNKPVGVVVDTHVQRISRRLGLTVANSPEKIEKDLMKIIPQNEWIWFSHCLVQFGRDVCNARKPKCTECPLQEICPSAKKFSDKHAKSASSTKKQLK